MSTRGPGGLRRHATDARWGRTLTVVFVLASLCLESRTGRVPAPAPRPPVVPERSERSGVFEKLPLAFEANEGQSDPEVRFLARAGSSTLFLTPSASVVAVGPGQAVRMRLEGANPAPDIEGLDLLDGRTNDYTGGDPARWRTNVPNYAKVAYRDVYPGIDLVFHGAGERFEYDLVVSPGSDPAEIALTFSGTSGVALDGDELVLGVEGGAVRQRAPVAYQDLPGGRRPVDGRYELSGGTVRFGLGYYEPAYPLVIDPVVYTKFVGGSATTPGGFSGDVGRGIAVDAVGNVYVTGTTQTANFPIVNPQDTFNGNESVFVFKLNPSGTTLLYSTYLASTKDDAGLPTSDDAYAIALDGAASAYVTGRTRGVDFPTTPGAYYGPVSFSHAGSSTAGSATYSANTAAFTPQDVFRVLVSPNVPADTRIVEILSPTSVRLSSNATATASSLDFTLLPRPNDAFVTKLTAAGNLSYSTYLGSFSGNGAEGRGIAVDAFGSAHVTGVQNPDITSSIDDQFVVKLDPSGSGAEYYTTIGGPDLDRAVAIALDAAGNAYVLGSSSGGYPVTPDALDSTPGGFADATVTRVSPSGVVTYATYLGGSGQELATNTGGIAVDASDNVYVALTTTSTDFPGTAARFQPAFAGGVGPNASDIVVAKLDPAAAPAAQLLWGTYLGGTGNDQAQGLRVDAGGNVYVAGGTSSTPFPLASPLGVVRAGSSEGVVAKLNPSGTGLVWSTYLGGNSDVDTAYGLAVDGSGTVYATGITASINFVAPPGASSPVPKGTGDVFVTKLTRAAAFRAADMDADGTSDLSVYRNGVWYLRTTTPQAIPFGVAGDIPVPADYDGDGRADLAVFRPGTGIWYIATPVPQAVAWGATGDVPVPADYDGDGKADLAVYRNGVWYLRTGTPRAVTFGLTGDVPVPADYDGDGDADLAVYRSGVWYLLTTTPQAIPWGASGDIPVPADYNGDNLTDLAVFRPSTGVWYIRTPTPQSVAWGVAGDIAVPADYAAQGASDVAVFRPSTGTWFRNGTATPWGANGDTPLQLPAAVRNAFFS